MKDTLTLLGFVLAGSILISIIANCFNPEYVGFIRFFGCFAWGYYVGYAATRERLPKKENE